MRFKLQTAPGCGCGGALEPVDEKASDSIGPIVRVKEEASKKGSGGGCCGSDDGNGCCNSDPEGCCG